MNERKNTIKRGKTGADLPPAMQSTESGLVSGSRDETAHSAGRPERVSMSNMKKLDMPESLKEEGFYYRWFQDRDGRIAQAKSAYYEHVVDEQGNNYCRPSGPYMMHYMRLPMKYREQDLKLKKQRVADTLETEAGIGANEYAPNGGESAITHTN